MSQGQFSITMFKTISLAVLLFIGTVYADNFKIPSDIIERVRQDKGDNAVQRLQLWEQLVNENKNQPELMKLRIVNQFFNQNAHYVADDDVWQKRDYWATPLEFIVKNAGDCEDYTIAKYFTLKKMGVPISKLRLTYVKAVELNQAHMVLTYYENPEDEPLVLDNIKPNIRYASERQDLLPVYSFNGDGLWITPDISTKGGKRVGTTRGNRMRLWMNLQTRMARDGLI